MTGVDVVPELVAMGQQQRGRPEPAVGPHRPAVPHQLGLPDDGPFDRILVSAEPGDIPKELEAQLAVGGRMVLPASGVMWVVDRDHEGWHREPVTGYRFSFVPLV